MFLKRTDVASDIFEVEFAPNYGEALIMLDDLSMVCGLKLENVSDSICNDYPLEGETYCVRWTPIVITPKPDVTPNPESEETPNPESEEDTEPEPETTDEDNPDDTVVDIDATDDGESNQSDQGYETKPEKGKNTAATGTSTDDENGSTLATASLLVTLITIFLTIVV